MFEQLTDLEEIITELERISSLFRCMCHQYFEKEPPDAHYLVVAYKDYVNIIDIIGNSLERQTELLQGVLDELHRITRKQGER